MRNIPSSLDPVVVATIDARLDAVSDRERVAIPWAIESGSRAWGFPSPDSDYDCRFVFVRAPEDYLDPWPRRDVIETPLDPVLDVNGWDLVKAVRLLVKGNATLVEWLASPIVYRGDAVFRDELLALAEVVVDRAALVRHYAHVGAGQHALWADGGRGLKKAFYALRPAAVLRWLRVQPGSTPPMDLRTLLVQGEAPDVLREAVDELVALKAVTREMGSGAVPEVVSRFVSDELGLALADGAGSGARAEPRDPAPGRPRSEAREQAAELFRSAVERYAPARADAR
ncbi:DNA polymerase beta superfamily protein [Oerskovia sp. NPDC057915]|uniref:nucleotidyltransferase domain-containing protein n=1 Tax=Oerskovia sp. NPDC057915 TaxID=3346280 RepID=UPI0036DED311